MSGGSHSPSNGLSDSPSDNRSSGLRLVRDYPLAALTTLGIGGTADRFVEAGSEEDILTALARADSGGLPVTVLGGGSNVLVSDDGIRGLVVRIRRGSARRIDRHTIRAFAGMTVRRERRRF